jgi:hypothetical protein
VLPLSRKRKKVKRREGDEASKLVCLVTGLASCACTFHLNWLRVRIQNLYGTLPETAPLPVQIFSPRAFRRALGE